MSREFDGINDLLNVNSTVLTAFPLSMACWFYHTASSNGQLMALTASANNNNWISITAGVTSVTAQTNGAGGFVAALTSAGYSLNTWNHACGVFSASNSRSAFVNGGSKVTNTTNSVPAGLARTSIGVLNRPTPVEYMTGRIAEAAIWNSALSDSQVASLAKGVSPLLIQPENLVFYAPLIGNNSPETDYVGSFNMTVTGAIKAGHSPVFNPRRRNTFQTSGASPAGYKTWWNFNPSVLGTGAA